MPAILFVSYSGVFGGSERVLLDCVAGAGGESLLACPAGPLAEPLLACPGGPLAERARAAGITVLELPHRPLDLRAGASARLGAVWQLAAHAREVRRLVRDTDPVLTVAWGMRSALAALAAPRGAPVAISHQDFLPGAVIARGVRGAAARAAAVFVPSAAVAADLDPAGRLGSRLHVVAPGVDVEHFAGIGAPPDAPVVLVLGALAGWKRPDLALEACAVARRELPGLVVRLVGAAVTGADDPSAALRARAAEPDLAGAVQFAGPTADPAEALASASCLLHCTPREPFGIVLLEAGAAGRPVVAPAAGGPSEIVDATSGILYPPGDAAAAGRALVDLLGSDALARELGAGGRARVRARFDRTRTRAGFAAALAPLLRAGAGARSGVAATSPSDDLAIVTVTHNSSRELEALLDSVARHLPGAQMICVDCGSDDDSVAVAAGRSWVTSVALGENAGFGRGCNRGLEHVTAPVTVLLNPDVVLIDSSLRELATEAARADRPERLLAPALLNADGTRQDGVHAAPGSAADLLGTLVPDALLPGRSGTALTPWRARHPRPVGWAIGAALAARTSTLRRLGPFNEQMFMYGEDLELGLRAGMAGVVTWFWPRARVIHTGAHATVGAFGGEDYARLARSRHAAIAIARGERAAGRDDAAQALTFASRVAVKRLLGRGGERELRQLAAVRALRRG
jgi:N-acetylglucosaminyl-diphospho-decaprenol L-rhamnosyltransferase